MFFFKKNSLVLFVVSLLMGGCVKESPPIISEVSGVYEAKYGEVREKLIIDSNGTFLQTVFLKDQSFKITGIWSIDGLGLKFSEILRTHDVNGKLLQFPIITSHVVAGWGNYKGSRRIDFDIDHGYVLDRVEE